MTKHNLKIVFAGTPAFTLPCLDALAASSHQIQAIYTQPDRPAGRGRKLQASAVKTWATQQQIPLYQPINFKDNKDIETLAELAPDVMIVIAYGLILPQRVLDIPRYGCINVHASLLPRWRGAAPIQYAILHGDEQTGITIMKMDAGMDTGPMYKQVSCPILPHDSSTELHDRLAHLAITPLLETLDELSLNQCSANPQIHTDATYAGKISKDDARINWHQSAQIIDQQIRAFNPWPIAFTSVKEGLTLRIHQAKLASFPHTNQTPGTIIKLDKHGMLVNTSQGTLLIERIQFPGTNIISIQDWLHTERNQLHVNLVLQ